MQRVRQPTRYFERDSNFEPSQYKSLVSSHFNVRSQHDDLHKRLRGKASGWVSGEGYDAIVTLNHPAIGVDSASSSKASHAIQQSVGSHCSREKILQCYLRKNVIFGLTRKLWPKMSFKGTVIKYAAALISGFLMTVILTIGFICKRSEFKPKKRSLPPKVLTDPTLGKHEHLSLRVSTSKYLHMDFIIFIRIMYRVGIL